MRVESAGADHWGKEGSREVQKVVEFLDALHLR
jgi:hypothetical protein